MAHPSSASARRSRRRGIDLCNKGSPAQLVLQEEEEEEEESNLRHEKHNFQQCAVSPKPHSFARKSCFELQSGPCWVSACCFCSKGCARGNGAQRYRKLNMMTNPTSNLHATRCGGGAAEPQGVAVVEATSGAARDRTQRIDKVILYRIDKVILYPLPIRAPGSRYPPALPASRRAASCMQPARDP